MDQAPRSSRTGDIFAMVLLLSSGALLLYILLDSWDALPVSRRVQFSTGIGAILVLMLLLKRNRRRQGQGSVPPRSPSRSADGDGH